MRARLGVASHPSTTSRWGNSAKCLPNGTLSELAGFSTLFLLRSDYTNWDVEIFETLCRFILLWHHIPTKSYHNKINLHNVSKVSTSQLVWFDWLIDFFIFILLSRESDGGAMRRTNPDSLRSCLCFQVFRLNFLLTSLICCLPDSTKQR